MKKVHVMIRWEQIDTILLDILKIVKLKKKELIERIHSDF
jgi:hypothetical protein